MLIQEQQEYVREVFVENSAMLLLTAIANPARLDDFPCIAIKTEDKR